MSDPEPILDRIGVLRPLRHRDFRLLWLGQTVSLVGDGVYLVAVAWLVYRDLHASPAAFAMIGLAWVLPQVFLLLATGALSDRMDRRHLMIVGDLVRLVVILAIGLLTLTGRITVPSLVVLVFAYGAGAAIFGPAFSAIVPMIVPGDLLVQANSIGQVVRPLAMTVIGPMVGGLLLTPGTGWAFVFDALTFAASAVCVWRMRSRPAAVDEGSEVDLFADIKVGVRYVRSVPWIKIGLLVGAVSLLCVWGPWETLVPFIVSRSLHGTGFDLALVFGAGGVGSVTVGVVMAQRVVLPRKPITTMYLAWALGMGMTAGFAVVTAVWQAMIVSFVAEASIAALVVIWITLLQRLVPGDLLGRVSSLDWLISISGAPVSFMIVGPLASVMGAERVLLLAGTLGALSTLVFMRLPGARDPERDGSLTDPGLASP